MHCPSACGRHMSWCREDGSQRIPLNQLYLLRSLEFALPLSSRLEDAPLPLLRRRNGLDDDAHFAIRIIRAQGYIEVKNAVIADARLDFDPLHGTSSCTHHTTGALAFASRLTEIDLKRKRAPR